METALVLEIQPVPTASAAVKQEDPVLRDPGLRADSYAVNGEGPPQCRRLGSREREPIGAR